MKSTIGMFITIFLLTGCGMSQFGEWASPEYLAKVQALKWKNIEDVIKDWGIPTKSIKLSDGSQIVEYYQTSKGYVPGYSQYTPQYSTHLGTVNSGGQSGSYSGSTYSSSSQHVPGRTVELRCKTTITTNPQGKIIGATAEGNQCR
jgi:hypothetical protein